MTKKEQANQLHTSTRRIAKQRLTTSSKFPTSGEEVGRLLAKGLKRVQELAKQGKLPKVY